MRHIAVGLCIIGIVGVAGCAASTKTEPVQEQSQIAAAPAPKTPGSAEFAPAERVVHFAFDSSVIDDANRRVVEAQGRYLRAHPNLQITLEGHADERGTDTYNRALGERRARAIAEALSTLGVNRARIRVVSYGEAKPIAPGHDEQAWRQNRRGVIVQ